jgi:hypothetical protein
MIIADDDVQNAMISIVQHRDTKRWRVLVQYDDGEEFLSREEYVDEAEATQVALAWGLANSQPEGPPQ